MSAAIQLVKSNYNTSDEALNEKPRLSIARFETVAEQRLPRDLAYIAELHAEIRDLRETLARVEHATAQQAALLRNAMVREHEYKAELARLLG